MNKNEIKRRCLIRQYDTFPIWDIDKCIEILQMEVDNAREEGELLAYNCEKKGRADMFNNIIGWLVLEGVEPIIINRLKDKYEKYNG